MQVYHVALSHTLSSRIGDAAPTAMIEKATGEALLALLTYQRALPLRITVQAEPNPWDDQLYENWRWFALSVAFCPLWCARPVIRNAVGQGMHMCYSPA